MAWCTRLALDLIDEHFGSSVRAVADALVALGPSSLPEVARVLAASPGFLGSAEQSIWALVRACLVTLISHDTIECSVSVEDDVPASSEDGDKGAASGVAPPPPSANATAGTLRYEFRPVAALRLMRIPHYIGIARTGFAGAGAAVAQVLLLRGTWTRGAAIAEAARVLMRDEAEAAEEAEALRSAAAIEGDGGEHAAGAAAATAAAGPQNPSPRLAAAAAGAAVPSLATLPRRRSLSNSSAMGGGEAAAAAAVAPRASERSALARVSGAWDAMVSAALISPHAGFAGFPEFLLASSARSGGGSSSSGVLAGGATAAAAAAAAAASASGAAGASAAGKKRRAPAQRNYLDDADDSESEEDGSGGSDERRGTTIGDGGA
jgi:hypothetical protein